MAIFYTFMFLCLFCAEFYSAESKSCENFETKKDFNVTRFIGRWYQVGLYSNDDGVEVYPCNRINYTVHQDGQCTNLHSKETKRSLNDPSITVTRTLDGKTCDPNKPARFMANPQIGVKQPHEWILETDYDTLAIIYRCTEGLDEEHNSIVILTRKQNPLQATTRTFTEFAINNIVNRFPRKIFKKSNQLNCRSVYDSE